MSRCSSRPDPLAPALLEALYNAGGIPISGTRLAQRLGLTRAAVWKHMQSLRAKGYAIESVPRRGYRLASVPAALERDMLMPWLGGTLFTPARCVVLAEADSSNRVAADMARAGCPEGTLVVVEHQSAGRGRLGRTWVAPPGCNLSFSLVLRPPILPGQAAQLTLLAALALAETARGLGLPEARIKWPNDLLVQGLKVAGVLTEMDAEAERVRAVVVGVGINVLGSVRQFPPELRQRVTTLAAALSPLSPPLRPAVLAAFLHHFEVWYQRWLTEGFAPIPAAWSAHAGSLGQSVCVHQGRETFCGIARGLDEQGFLLVEHADGSLTRVVSGDVLPAADPPHDPTAAAP
ncbi:MAG: biotin--[acetyl-CoA-carboxylase] ligase [Magnetococcus sp. WYHC-3]